MKKRAFNKEHLQLEAATAVRDATTRDALGDNIVIAVSSLGAEGVLLGIFCTNDADIEWSFQWSSTAGGETSWLGKRWRRASWPSFAHVSATSPLLCEACSTDPRFGDEERNQLAAAKIGSIALYPLTLAGRFFGVIAITYEAPHAFTEAERDFFSFIAALGSIVFDRIAIREEFERHAKRTKAIRRAAQSFGEQRTEKELLANAALLLIDGFAFADTSIFMYDGNTDTLREGAFAGGSKGVDRKMPEFPASKPEIGIVKAYLTGEPIVELDVLLRADAEGWGQIARAAKLRSAAIIPIYAGDRPLGALGVGQAHVEITENDVTTLLTFASQLGIAIARARADQETQTRLAELEAAYQQQVRLVETIKELSTPVIPVHQGIVALPLVGTIDSSRIAQIMDSLLDSIQKESASVVIIDVTGVPMIDTSVANHLLKATRAASLLGARCILVGISPQVAQTLVHLDIDLSGLMLQGNLRGGFAQALSFMDLEIRPKSRKRGTNE